MYKQCDIVSMCGIVCQHTRVFFQLRVNIHHVCWSSQGFGAGNFKALFEAIEEVQLRIKEQLRLKALEEEKRRLGTV